MTTQSDRSDASGLDLIKSIPEALKMYDALLRKLELYRLLYGDIEDQYGKVDTLLALKTYRENESFQKNFSEYMEALRIQLDKVTDMVTGNQEPSNG